MESSTRGRPLKKPRKPDEIISFAILATGQTTKAAADVPQQEVNHASEAPELRRPAQHTSKSQLRLPEETVHERQDTAEYAGKEQSEKGRARRQKVIQKASPGLSQPSDPEESAHEEQDPAEDIGKEPSRKGTTKKSQTLKSSTRRQRTKQEARNVLPSEPSASEEPKQSSSEPTEHEHSNSRERQEHGQDHTSEGEHEDTISRSSKGVPSKRVSGDGKTDDRARGVTKPTGRSAVFGKIRRPIDSPPPETDGCERGREDEGKIHNQSVEPRGGAPAFAPGNRPRNTLMGRNGVVSRSGTIRVDDGNELLEDQPTSRIHQDRMPGDGQSDISGRRNLETARDTVIPVVEIPVYGNRRVGSSENAVRNVRGLDHTSKPPFHVVIDDDDFNGDELFAEGAGEDSAEENETPAPESDGSGSDYSGTERARKRRLQRASRNIVETDEEDAELDVEMEAELTGDEMVPDVQTNKQQRAPRLTSSQQGPEPQVDKGKGRALSPVEEQDEEPPATAGRRLKPGPLSDREKELIDEFSRQVLAGADEFAAEFGKKRSDILAAAGLGHVKNTRAVNSANAFRKWYSVHNPKPENVGKKDYGKEMDRAYRALRNVTDEGDESDSDESPALPIIVDWYNRYKKERAKERTTGVRSSRSIGSRMKSARDTFTTLAASYRNCEDLEIVGGILYMGPDAGAKQMSALFGSSEAVRELIVDHNVDVRQILDNLTTALKAINLKNEGWSIPNLLIQPEDPLDCRRTEHPRDYHRRLLGYMLKVQLQEYDSSPIAKFQWKKWAETAYKWRVCIVDWPAAIPPPGAGFKMRTLTEQTLKPTSEAYIRHCREGTDETFPRIVPWSQRDVKLFESDDIANAATIALVRSDDKVSILLNLCASDNWCEESGYKKRKTKTGKASASARSGTSGEAGSRSRKTQSQAREASDNSEDSGEVSSDLESEPRPPQPRPKPCRKAPVEVISLPEVEQRPHQPQPKPRRKVTSTVAADVEMGSLCEVDPRPRPKRPRQAAPAVIDISREDSEPDTALRTPPSPMAPPAKRTKHSSGERQTRSGNSAHGVRNPLVHGARTPLVHGVHNPDNDGRRRRELPELPQDANNTTQSMRSAGPGPGIAREVSRPWADGQHVLDDQTQVRPRDEDRCRPSTVQDTRSIVATSHRHGSPEFAPTDPSHMSRHLSRMPEYRDNRAQLVRRSDVDYEESHRMPHDPRFMAGPSRVHERYDEGPIAGPSHQRDDTYYPGHHERGGFEGIEYEQGGNAYHYGNYDSYNDGYARTYNR